MTLFVSILHAPAHTEFGMAIAQLVREKGYDLIYGQEPYDPDAFAATGAATIIIWSPSICRDSDAMDQAARALAQGSLIPISLDRYQAPSDFASVSPIDMSGWSGDPADPRWRFVLDEIELAHQRLGVSGVDAWARRPISADQDSAEKHSVSDEQQAFAQSLDQSPGSLDQPLKAAMSASVSQASSQAGMVEPSSTTHDYQGQQDGMTQTEQPGWHQAGGLKVRRALVLGLVLLMGVFLGAILYFTVSTERVPPVASVSQTQDPEPESSPEGTSDIARDDSRVVDITSDQALRTEENEDSLAKVALVHPAPANEDDALPLADLSVNAASVAAETTHISNSEIDDVERIAELKIESTDAETAVPSGINETTDPVSEDKPATIKNGNAEASDIDVSEASPTQTVASADDDTVADLIAEITGEGELESSEDARAILAPGQPWPAIDTRARRNFAAAFEEAKPGLYSRDCLRCPDMAPITPGTFIFGADKGALGVRPNEVPAKLVTLKSSFAISIRETTFSQWLACVEEGGCKPRAFKAGWGGGERPVINVSFGDAQDYAQWLSNKTGHRYRLPTEAEWEYASRGGAVSVFSFGDRLSVARANYNARFPFGGKKATPYDRTLPAGAFPPNGYGLFDMHGNVSEWTSDCWTPSHANTGEDGSPQNADCSARVIKGGAWSSGGWRLRSVYRADRAPDGGGPDLGFRVVREIQ